MGGHGGLNILPQKRWNVYNQDNRYKVAQDEAKANKKNREDKKRKEDGQRKVRRNILLNKAGAAKTNDEDRPELEAEENARHEFERDRKETRRRGKKSEQTSDARFDERFKFAYGLQDSKPWYLLPRAPVAANQTSDMNPSSSMDKDAKEKKSAKAKRKATRSVDDPHQSKKMSKKELARRLLSGVSKSGQECNLVELRKERLKREQAERQRTRDLLNK